MQSLSSLTLLKTMSMMLITRCNPLFITRYKGEAHNPNPKSKNVGVLAARCCGGQRVRSDSFSTGLFPWNAAVNFNKIITNGCNHHRLRVLLQLVVDNPNHPYPRAPWSVEAEPSCKNQHLFVQRHPPRRFGRRFLVIVIQQCSPDLVTMASPRGWMATRE